MDQAVSLLPGVENIKNVYERALNSRHVDFICLSSNYEAVLGSWYDQEYSPKLFGSQAKTREIVVETPDNRTYGSKKDLVKNQVRYLLTPAESDLIIGDNFIAIISFNTSSPYVVVFEDEAIVNSVKTWFEAIWESAAR